MAEIAEASLRRVLLRRLLWPLIPILLLGVLLAYVLAQRAAVNAYDAGLIDDARDLANQIAFQNGRYVMELPHAAAEMLATNNEDRVIYAIWTTQGEAIAGDAAIAPVIAPPRANGYTFQDVSLTQKTYRVIVLRQTFGGTDILIAVAQTTKGRTQLLEQIFLSMLFLGGVLVIASIAVVVSGVHAGLLPVEKLRNEIASRSTSDLQPLPENSAPLELRPIIRGINELLEKLSASFASYRRFIADAAHQLRTPLAALGTQIEVNLAQPPDNVSILLQQLLATTQRTSHLANQLLSLARLEHTENAAIGETIVDLRELVQETAADFVLRAARYAVEFEFSVQPLHVHGNALLLRELLSNLLDNAVRYAPRHSVIQVYLNRSGDAVELIVADAGPGVPAADLQKLGTPFYRPPGSAAEGCGLGLAIVREIAHIHRGSVTFAPSSTGVGLTVELRMPLAKRDN